MKTKQTTNREGFSPNENIILSYQVDGVCPKCQKALIRKSGNKFSKAYDIAHIYPLNPKAEEIIELRNEVKLTTNPNDIGNLIPLCHTCHEEFDNPRTKEGYRAMVLIKKQVELATKKKGEWYAGHLESDIRLILEELSEHYTIGSTISLSYDPKKVDQKADNTLSELSKKIIKYHNSEYYGLIREKNKDLEAINAGISDIIAVQVKLQYMKLKAIDPNQQKILEALINWIQVKVPTSSHDACHILISFYIQNCEVF